MYTEQDLTAVSAQKKKRILLLCIPCALLLAALVVCIIRRSEVWSDVCTILLGVCIIAGLDLLVKPLHCYEKHLHNVLHDVTHDLECEYVSFSEDLSEVDGVVYRTLTVLTYDEKGKPFDRIFYYDVQKPLPSFTAGQRVRVTYHDREVGALTAI